MDHKEELTLKILKIFGWGVLFSVLSILAPKFPYLVLKHYLKQKFDEEYRDAQLRVAVKYLKRKKFIAYSHGKFWLTKLGRNYLEKAEALEIVIKKTPWDQKWRVVSFDIPENFKAARHVLRRKLQESGFYHFQRSVFILPYNCEQELKELTKNLNIEDFVYIWTTSRFRGDKQLVKYFKL